jgi:hypothetical protein
MQTLVSSIALRIQRVLALALLTCVPLHAITFKNPPVIPTSTDVTELASADVNNDGKLDIVYIDGSAAQFALHVLLGSGDGTFMHGQDIGLPAGVCCALTIADVTGDGKPDLIIAGSTSTVAILAVLPGNGDGTFQPPVLTSFVPPGFTGFLHFVDRAVGDINGDGKMDVVLFTGPNIFLLLGNNSGSFTFSGTLQSYQNGGNIDSMYLLDLNGDSHPDILTTDALGADFEVFLGKGDGTFSNFTRYSAGTPAGPFLLADVDGDGHPDVLTVYFEVNQPYQLGYFKNNLDGTFSTLTNVGASPSQGTPLVSAGDLNSDGIPDLTFLTPSGLAVSLGQSGPSFGSTHTTISGGSMSPYSTLPTKPVLGDFNGDGHTDIAIAVEGGIVLLFGKGNGTFISDDFYDMGQPVGSATVAKFSASGNMDIAVTLPAPFPRLLLGDGKGSFTLGPDPNSSYGSQAPVVTVLAADFNGDGKPDLNLGDMLPNTSSSATQSVAFNLGNGIFSAPVAVPNSSPIIADFNGDGRKDIINVSGMQIIVSLGQSNNTFVPVTTPLRLPFDTGLFNVGDVNNDGKPDLVINYRDHLEIWLGNGDGTFTYSSSLSVQNIVSAAVAAVSDVDGDGNVDIILSPESNPAGSISPLAIFYGNGNGTFLSPVFIPIAHRYSQVVVADINRDHLPDLVMTDGAAIAVVMNLGGRKFDAEVDYVAGRSISGFSVVDVNSDGYPDIVVANGDGYYGVQGPNFSGTTVTVLLNEPNGTTSNGAPVTGTLSVAPEPSIAGQSFTITLAVSSQTSGGPTPTGTVGFSLDGAFLADMAMANGSASYAFTGVLIPIQHTITATYNGDSNYAPKSFSIEHTVQAPTYSTQTILSASPTTLMTSQTIRLWATVTGAVPVPAGTVTFFDGSNSLGAATINSAGVAYLDTALLVAGVHTLSAKFQGYTQYGLVAAVFSPSTSSSVAVTVTSIPTVTSLVASSNSPTAGTVVTFTAQVNSNAGTPFGSTTFYDGNVLLGTLSLDAGSGSFSTASLAAGSHSITAGFNPNGPFAGSTSAPNSISVLAAPATAISTIVSLAPEANPSDNSSSLVANVSAPKGAPTGIVTFLERGTILGTAVTNQSGLATLRVGTLGSGFHSFTASFAGGSEFAPGVSPALYDQWPETGPGFTVTLGARTLSVKSPGSESLQISIEPLSAFRQRVQLSCAGGLPEAYDCTFSPGTLNGGGVSTLTIQPIATSAQGSSRMAPLYGLTFGVLSFALLGSLTRRSRGLFLLVICCSLGLLSGCGTASSPVDYTQRLVLTIRAESGTGPDMIVHSTQVTLIVPSTK